MHPKSTEKRVWRFAVFLIIGLFAGRFFIEQIRGVPNQARQRHLIRASQDRETVTTVFLGMSPIYYGVNPDRFDAKLHARGVESKSLVLALGGAAAFELQELFEKVLADGLPKLRTVYISDILMQHHLRRRSLNKNESLNQRGLQLYVNQLLAEPWNKDWLLAWKDLLETIFFRATNWGVAYYNRLQPDYVDHYVYPEKSQSLPLGACKYYEDWIQPASKEWPQLAEPLVKLAQSRGAQVYFLHSPFRTPGSCKGFPNCIQPLDAETEQELLSEQYWWDCDHLNKKGAEKYTDALAQAALNETDIAAGRGLSSQ